MPEIPIDQSLIDSIKPAKLRRKRARAWDDTLYHVALRWARLADGTFEQWPGRPDCGHFYGGSYWYGNETAHTALTLASLVTVGPYDEAVSGASRQQLADHVIAAIRYLGFTHDSGPADCVRAKGPNPHASERKWGGEGDGFFQASQHGVSVACLGQAAWLLWDRLDGETKQLVVNAVSTYADTWRDHPAADGVYVNTQTEENGWTAQGLSVAALMMPDHPRATQWADAAQRWVANVCMTPYDRGRNREPLQGRPVSQWAEAITTHPDFTAENHDFVHPNYMGSGISFAAAYAVYCRHAGEPIPDVVRFNREPLYDVLKSWAEPDGSLTPVQGQDWWYVTHHGLVLQHAAMSLLFGDPQAAYLERRAAETCRQIADSVGGGNLFISNPESARLNQFQSMRTAERGAISALMRAYVLHCAMGDGAEPVTPTAFDRSRRGIRVFENGGLATRRGKGCFAAFSWRNRPLVLVQPKGRSWQVTPHPQSMLGTIRTDENWGGGMCDGRARVDEDGQSMAAVMEVEREGGALAQQVALLAPSDDVAMYFDQVKAQRDLRITEQRGGEISIRNEHYEQLGALADGRRRVWTSAGEAVAESRFGGEDEWFRWPRARWVNVDDCIGYVVFGSAGVSYQACHAYATYRGLEDFLILNHVEEPREVKGGRLASRLAVAIGPNQDHEATRSMAESTLRPRTPANADALVAGNWLGVVNFSSRRRDVKLTWPAGETVPVFEGRARIHEGKVTLTVSLAPLSARAFPALAEIDPEDRTVVGAGSGEVFVEEPGGWKRVG